MVYGSLDPNITILGEKLWPEYIRKKSKNAYKKRENENFQKQKKNVFFSCPKDHSTQNLGS